MATLQEAEQIINAYDTLCSESEKRARKFLLENPKYNRHLLSYLLFRNIAIDNMQIVVMFEWYDPYEGNDILEVYL